MDEAKAAWLARQEASSRDNGPSANAHALYVAPESAPSVSEGEAKAAWLAKRLASSRDNGGPSAQPPTPSVASESAPSVSEDDSKAVGVPQPASHAPEVTPPVSKSLPPSLTRVEVKVDPHAVTVRAREIFGVLARRGISRDEAFRHAVAQAKAELGAGAGTPAPTPNALATAWLDEMPLHRRRSSSSLQGVAKSARLTKHGAPKHREAAPVVPTPTTPTDASELDIQRLATRTRIIFGEMTRSGIAPQEAFKRALAQAKSDFAKV